MNRSLRRAAAAAGLLIGAGVALISTPPTPPTQSADLAFSATVVTNDPAAAERSSLRMVGTMLGLFDTAANVGVAEEEAYRLAALLGIDDLRLSDDLEGWGYVPWAEPTAVYIKRDVLAFLRPSELVGLLAHERVHTLIELHGGPTNTAILLDGITPELAAAPEHRRNHEAAASCMDVITAWSYRDAPCSPSQHLALWDWAEATPGARPLTAVLASKYVSQHGPVTIHELRDIARIGEG